MNRTRAVTAAALIALTASACHKGFDPKIYNGNPDALFAGSLKQFNGHHYEESAKGFEELTHSLPARDPLLPLSYYYLGESQIKTGDYLLAAQSLTRISEGFPDDSLAPRALLEGGRAYAKMWRKPELDPTYGHSAQTTLQSLVSLYPESPLVADANRDLAHLDDLFAQKDLQTGEHYVKRGAYDSAIIYLKDVVKLHPNTPSARHAYFLLLDSYRAIRYAADARDVCDTMTKTYPGDREVVRQCGSASSAAASTPRT